MKTNRRTAVLPAAGVLLALGTAARAADAVRYRALPYPFPNPKCGDYVDDCPKPTDDCPSGDWDVCHPMVEPLRSGRRGALEDLKGRMSGVTGAIRDNDFSKAGAALDGLFSGAGAASGEAGVVTAGNPSAPADEGVSGIRVEKRAYAVLTLGRGGIFGAYIGDKVQDTVRDAISEYNNSQTENERKYEEGTAAWNKTHEDWIRRHSGDNDD